MRRASEQRTPVGSDLFIPNHSGDHSAGRVLRTATNATDIANKAYVDTKSTIGTTMTTKGDLLTYTTGNVRLPVGSNTQVLTAENPPLLGLKIA